MHEFYKLHRLIKWPELQSVKVKQIQNRERLTPYFQTDTQITS